MQTIETIPVSPSRRAEILNFASHLLPEPERKDAEAVTAMAEPLLRWAAEAFSADDQTARMNAMRQQRTNTPDTLARLAGSRVLVQFPSVTPEEFLAGARHLYGFIAAQSTEKA